MRIKIVFSYDGSKFNGFQRQKKDRSVQGEIEKALSKIYDDDIEIKGAGRTDAGVHAIGQVAHFDAIEDIPKLKEEMNKLLNPDIVIKDVSKESFNFHARFSAIKKEYVYKINLGPFQAFLNDYYYQPRFKLDVKAMKSAAKLFVGTYDFRNFVAGEKDDTTTTIYSIKFKERFGKLEISFIGAGFYRYMVRNLVGALIEIGKYKIDEDTIKEMLYNPRVAKSLPTAPSEGLYLKKIWYK